MGCGSYSVSSSTSLYLPSKFPRAGGQFGHKFLVLLREHVFHRISPESVATVVEKTNGPNHIFHTKLAFLRAILETKAPKNCLVLLRVNQNVQEEHNL